MTRRGVSLVEALLAAGLLLAAVVPLVTLATRDRAGSAALDRELAATLAAAALMEQLKTLPYEGVLTTGGRELREKLPGPEELVRTLSVEEAEPWPGGRPMKRAIVRVRWTQPGGGRTGEVELATLLAPASALDETAVPEP